MAISADLVKQLRERSGAGMMDCKKALVEADGDIDAALEVMRRQGLAKADKKADRTAAEGQIVVEAAADGSRAVVAEVNSETDFTAGNDDFQRFAAEVGRALLEHEPADIEAAGEMTLDSGETLEDARRELIARVGEKITLRRFRVVTRQGDHLGSYTHGLRIGVVVDLRGGDEQLARDLAMHVAASGPICIGEKDIPQERLERERDTLRAQAEESGKPADIVEKMVEGRLKKTVAELTLLGQPFVKDPDQTVGEILDERGAQVMAFERYEVGEGIEKNEQNFADEVMSQVRDS